MEEKVPSPSQLKRILTIAIPLMLATSGHAFRLFADRVMLARYSPSAIAAAMPAGLGCFCLMAFFIGTAGYAGTFVSQYIGADRPEETGKAIWQGIFLALIGSIIIGLSPPLANHVFAWMNHGSDVYTEQVIYFEVLAKWSFSGILLAVLNAFWSGRGKTKVVMIIELIAAATNVLLNDWLIFGKAGMPELGIMGAGLATAISSLIGCIIAFTLFLLPGNRRAFGTWPKRAFQPELAARLLKFGLPNGTQFTLELMAFNLFVIFLGRLGQSELEAANMAFGLNAMVFLPLIGLGMSVSILVGQCVGGHRISEARRIVYAGVALACAYNVIAGILMMTIPEMLVQVFARSGDATQGNALDLASIYIRFVAAYLFFDGLFIVFSHAIRGAGDTRFAMLAGLSLSWGTLVLPAWLVHSRVNSAVPMWLLMIGHITLMALVFFKRFRGGKWEQMRVVEDPPICEIDWHAEGGL